MIEISIWKILVVLMVALILLGPEQLPKVARLVGRLVGQFRTATSGLQKELKIITTEQSPEDPSKNKQQE